MITLAFFLFLFCICILCCFLTQKAPFRCFFLVSFGFGTVLFFWCFRRFPPVLLDGGHHREVVRFVKMLRYPLVSCRYPVFSVNACIYSTLRPFLCQHSGALPQTPASLVAPQGQAVKTQPPDPVAKCWVGSKASRVKCTASPPLTPLHLRESSKTIRSGRSWKPVKACEATACGLAFTGWRRPNVCGKGAGGFPCTPATWRTRVWAAPTVLARPLGVAQ